MAGRQRTRALQVKTATAGRERAAPTRRQRACARAARARRPARARNANGAREPSGAPGSTVVMHASIGGRGRIASSIHCAFDNRRAENPAAGDDDGRLSVQRHRSEVAGALGEPRHVPRGRGGRHVAAEVLRARHVSVSERRRLARRASGRLHGVRHRRALQAHARLQRAASDGLGRVRPARRAICAQDRHAPEGDHRAQRAPLPRAAQDARFLVRLAARGQHDGPRLLPLDAVDLQAALRARARLSRGAAGLVVPGARHHARQRGGHRRQIGSRAASRACAGRCASGC